MDQWLRGVLLIALCATLGWSLVAFAAVEDVRGDTIRDAETTAVLSNPADHVGERVVVDGTVVRTSPLVVQTRYPNGTKHNISVTGTGGEDIANGDHLYAFGRLTDPKTLTADRVVVQKSWERQYTLVVSFLGGLLLAARLVRDWGWNFSQMWLVPQHFDAETESKND